MKVMTVQSGYIIFRKLAAKLEKRLIRPKKELEQSKI